MNGKEDFFNYLLAESDERLNTFRTLTCSGVSGLTLAPHYQGQQRQTELQSEKFESQIRLLANEIHSTIQQHMNGLQSRRDQLLQQLDTIKKIYLDVLENRPLVCGTSDDSLDGEDEPLALPEISFTKPDHALHKAVSSLGFLTAPAFAPKCTATGEGLEFAVPGVTTSFVIVTRNCFNEELLLGRENIVVKITAITPASLAPSVSPTETHTGNGGNSLAIGLAPYGSSGRDSSFGGSWSPFGMSNLSSSTSPSSTNTLTTTSSLSSGLSSGHNSPPTRTVINHSLLDHNNGKYTVGFLVPVSRVQPDRIVISVVVNGLSLNGSPYQVPVKTQQRQTWKKMLTFGSEGNSIGQFCRPWGVAIIRMPQELSSRTRANSANSTGKPDILPLVEPIATVHSPKLAVDRTVGGPIQQPYGSGINSGQSTNDNSSNSSTNGTSNSANNEYLMAVADRSNNRVQVFKYDQKANQLSVLNVFGSGPGTRHGQFDRPAGICFNASLGHIIVADKDNHRVQVFDFSGQYLFKFGDKGNRVGNFCYPWDVDACPATHQIAVSDTRNRRVQLFTPFGQYVMHFSQPLDSPRGVGFLGEGRLVVSDFNKHRLLIFEKFSREHPESSASSNSSHSSTSPSNGQTPKSIGFGEGSGWGEFLRPQGLSVCGQFVFCSDSRNNRVCLYNLTSQVFEYLTDNETGLDRPSGIASCDKIMACVDFGNNRVQIYHR